MLIGDSFAQYEDDADFRAAIGPGKLYNDGSHQHLVHLDQAVTYEGHATVRIDQERATGQLWPRVPHALTNVWLRVVHRFGYRWTAYGDPTKGDASYKVIGLGWNPRESPHGRIGVHLAGGTGFQVGCDWHGAPFVWRPAGRLTTYARTRFMEHILHFDAAGRRVRYWRTAATASRRTLCATLDLPPNPPSVAVVFLGQNLNQLPVKPQSLHIGEWSVHDGSKEPNPFGLR